MASGSPNCGPSLVARGYWRVACIGASRGAIRHVPSQRDRQPFAHDHPHRRGSRWRLRSNCRGLLQSGNVIGQAHPRLSAGYLSRGRGWSHPASPPGRKGCPPARQWHIHVLHSQDTKSSGDEDCRPRQRNKAAQSPASEEKLMGPGFGWSCHNRQGMFCWLIGSCSALSPLDSPARTERGRLCVENDDAQRRSDPFCRKRKWSLALLASRMQNALTSTHCFAGRNQRPASLRHCQGVGAIPSTN